jgi:serine phosphatase RsbU (regulator of sigma subunit)
VPISPEETILLYTDGVTDARATDERFGVGRLKQLLAEHAGEPPPDLLARLSEALDRFEDETRTDDMAMLALRRVPNVLSEGNIRRTSGVAEPGAPQAQTDT